MLICDDPFPSSPFTPPTSFVFASCCLVFNILFYLVFNRFNFFEFASLIHVFYYCAYLVELSWV